MLDKVKELIKKSLSYYDKNNELHANLYEKFKYYSMEISKNDTEHGKIKFYDDDDNLVFESKYEILGFYDSLHKLWGWGWAVPFFHKNQVLLSRKILNYGLDLSSGEETFLKSELITSRFIVTDPIQLTIHAAIASYISKTSMIYNVIIHRDELMHKKPKYKLLKTIKPETISYYIYLLNDK